MDWRTYGVAKQLVPNIHKVLAMCNRCEFEVDEWMGDVSERFAFEEDKLDYYDAPLSGWMRCRSCDRRYVFACEGIVPGALWHWSLIAASSGETGVDEIFAQARRDRSTGSWISIVEDRRSSARCLAATVLLSRAVPPFGS